MSSPSVDGGWAPPWEEFYSEDQPRDERGRFGSGAGSDYEPTEKNFDHAKDDWLRYDDSQSMQYLSERILGHEPDPDRYTYLSSYNFGELDKADLSRYTQDQLVQETVALMDKIKDVDHPSIVPLYRGFSLERANNGAAQEFIDKLEVGDTFDLPLASFSPDQNTAESFSAGVLFRAEPGVKAVPNDYWPQTTLPGPGGRQYPTSGEWLTDGRFTVTGMSMGTSGDDDARVIDIRQEGVWDPKTGKLA